MAMSSAICRLEGGQGQLLHIPCTMFSAAGSRLSMLPLQQIYTDWASSQAGIASGFD